jgi:Protein of unknown function (DUF2974)
MSLIDVASSIFRFISPPPPPPPPPPAPVVESNASYVPEPSYHPQLASFPTRTGGSSQGATGPYSLPPGSTLAETAGGTQAQPFDVTLSQLATAVYGTRGVPPEGWTAVSDQDLQDRGISDPTAWRQQFLGGGEQTTAQEFKAEIYRDSNDNFVLSYRGTAEGAADWENNFRQAAGFQTDGVDKFSGTAVNTAVEFKRVFGEPQGSNPTNLAITGHSQGGGLASVGSLASGVPAVTFDASGIHPNTLDRMGFDPQQARNIAEGGQMRAYSLNSDLLTQTQESGLLGLIAPDALGTSIVVEPGPLAQRTLAGRAAGVEWNLPNLPQAGVNGLVESLRHSHIPLVDDVGDLAYSALSHNPNVLTAAMIEKQPWQAGYENPSDLGKTLQDLLPDVLKDDYARNTNDLVTDIADVVNTDFRDGDYVQGGFRIGGDATEGFFNSAGDTMNRSSDSLAQAADRNVPGPFGDFLSGGISLSGDLMQGGADVTGTVLEAGLDGAGYLAQTGTDAAERATGWIPGTPW